MKKLVYVSDTLISVSIRVIKRLWKVEKSNEFPEGLEFAIQLLDRDNKLWKQILRIDNQLHDGKPGVHIHKKGYVQWLDITFEEAEELIGRYANEN